MFQKSALRAIVLKKSADRGRAFYAYEVNYLIDTDNAVIVDVEATTASHLAIGDNWLEKYATQ